MNLDFSAIGPMLAVGIGALLLPLAQVLLERKRSFLSKPLTRERRGMFIAMGSLACLVVAGITALDGLHALTIPGAEAAALGRVFNPAHPMLALDGLALFSILIILLGASMTVLTSVKYLADMRINHGEYYTLILSSVLGMMFLVASTDMLLLFLSLELMSIPIYVLAGFQRSSLRSNESALKYFLIGSFASAVLLYGISLLYGATGELSLAGIKAAFDPESPLDMVGAALVLVGLAFKISSVPFHQWAPDVYEGAPTTVTGFMATTVKVAAFAVLIRIVSVALAPAAAQIYGVLWLLAVLTMTVGNVMAIIQPNIKRMLAYSSIAHAGYVLIGVIVGGQSGYSAVLFYLLVYTFMTIGAFGVVSVLAKGGRDRDRVEDFVGLGVTRPFLAVAMTVFMFSLAGIPGFAGFIAKFQLFRAAIEQGMQLGDTSLYWLAIIGVLNSGISLAYYLRIPLVMYMREPAADADPDSPGFFERVVLVTCVIATIFLGILPQLGDLGLLDDAGTAVQQLAQLR